MQVLWTGRRRARTELLLHVAVGLLGALVPLLRLAQLVAQLLVVVVAALDLVRRFVSLLPDARVLQLELWAGGAWSAPIGSGGRRAASERDGRRAPAR